MERERGENAKPIHRVKTLMEFFFSLSPSLAFPGKKKYRIGKEKLTNLHVHIFSDDDDNSKARSSSLCVFLFCFSIVLFLLRCHTHLDSRVTA